jgi:hypothetical protein
LGAVGQIKASTLSITNQANISGMSVATSQITGYTLRMGPFNGLIGIYWRMTNHNDENLGFYQDRTENGEIREVLKGYIEDDGTAFARMNFTGQHRCFIKDYLIQAQTM